METQRVDLGAYKTSLSRLGDKYNDVDDSEIVERGSRGLRMPPQPFTTSELRLIVSMES